MSKNLNLLGEYSDAMAAGDEETVFAGQIVEHWGGPHRQDGLGLTH
jgi:hypothetical protein